MAETVLSIKNLRVNFQRRGAEPFTAVKGLSLQLKAGESIAVVGESGSGKSVTALALGRLLPEPPAVITADELNVAGHSVLSMSEREMQRVRELSMRSQTPDRRLSNEWRHSAGLIDHTYRGITTPNCDTLYSGAWLDLAEGPILIEVPASGLPYWSIAVMDLNTDNIAIFSLPNVFFVHSTCFRLCPSVHPYMSGRQSFFSSIPLSITSSPFVQHESMQIVASRRK